jgi:hypothetical protein
VSAPDIGAIAAAAAAFDSAKSKAKPAAKPGAPPVRVFITREHGVDFFILHIPKADGTIHTEELEPEEALEWFVAHGADKIVADKALEHVWNFYKGAIEIVHYKEPPIRNAGIAPHID